MRDEANPQGCGHICQDIRYVIHLTRHRLLLPRTLIDEPPQLAQPISTEQSATGADRDYKIGLENVGPLERQRAQPPVRARIRDTVAAPVVAHREQIERLPS